MKLTVKLLIGLSIFLLFLMTISAFSIKKQFEKIDKNDQFWSFEKRETGRFSHVKIIGNTKITGKLAIIQGPKFQLNVSGRLSKNLKTNLIGDTLVISFKLGKEDIPAYQMTSTEIVLISNELKSLLAIDQIADVQGFNQESIRIDCGFNSNVSFEKNIFKNIKLTLGENSNFNFNSQTGIEKNYDFQPENLDVEMKRNSSLNMSNVLPKHMTLNNDEHSFLNLNSATLKLLRK